MKNIETKKGKLFICPAFPCTKCQPTPESEEATGFRLPSDLDGLTVLRYEMRGDHSHNAAVNVACRTIKRKIASWASCRIPQSF